MKIDNVSFQDAFVQSFKTEKEFLDEMEGEGYKHIYEGKGRKDNLKKAYAVHHKKPKSQNEGGGEISHKP
jgi:hypothetical protein